jgi:NAD(P)-dependent dehydrogenase (short-subunit alcohol dehydrogenase family)
MATKRPRLIVITGATRGLGLALTERFIELGHTVLGCGRTQAAIERLRRTFGPPHDFAVVDVREGQHVQAWAERLLQRHPAPDLLINNAALINRNAPLWQVPPEEFDQVIDVNIKGVYHVLRAFLPAMIARQAGVIVNLSSYWGRSTSAEVAPYCTSKWAIEGLTQALAQELPSGLAAVALNPGIIDTDMLRTCFGEEAGKYPSAKEWAEKAALFILDITARDNGKALAAPH